MQTRRIWLYNVGVFEIIPNSGNGSCLFQAISQALTFSPKHHNKIRSAVVEHMTCHKWAEKLQDFPEFWRHKIISAWLQKEKHALTQQSRHINLSFTQILCCYKWLRIILAQRKRSQYRRIERLLQRKVKPYYSQQLEDFKFVFKKFMSGTHEPATRFELEAAANKFRFHFDYLQTIPMQKKSFHATQIDITDVDDILNNNFTHSKTEVDADKDETIKHENLKVPVKMAMFQFHGCRNRGCRFPRSCPTFEHFYFLHSPLGFQGITKECDSDGKSPRKTVPLLHHSEEYWHWELLLPIVLRANPMPLNRRIFGLFYEITESARKFSYTLNGERREIQDEVAEAIDLFVKKNPHVIPPEDTRWPADDVDNYSGCAAALKDSFWDWKEEFYFCSSKRVVLNREELVKNCLRND